MRHTDVDLDPAISLFSISQNRRRESPVPWGPRRSLCESETRQGIYTSNDVALIGLLHPRTPSLVDPRSPMPEGER